MWTTTTIIFTILFIAVVVCLIIGFNGYWQWIVAALILLVLIGGMVFMLGLSVDTELSSKDMMYSSPLVSINDASKGDVTLSNNVYVVENNDGEYIVEDCKGKRTKDYIIKRKLMLQKYGVRIKET